jgi:hypothetical protein
MWITGVGSDVMKPIAAPIIGGMVTSTIHVLIVTPRSSRNRTTARDSRLAHWPCATGCGLPFRLSIPGRC